MDIPIEGYFLVTNEGLIFEVKGNLHSKNYYIAYLRYVVDTYGDRESKDGVVYNKIYPLKNREKFLRENYPHYLKYDQKYARVLQVVPFNSVDFVLNPIDALAKMRDSGEHLEGLRHATRKLAELFVDSIGIPWDSIGVTGSQLVGLETEESDIDLVVYGENACSDMYQGLKKKIGVLTGIERYTGAALQKHTQFRWGSNNQNFEILRLIESGKLLQGLFYGYEFFIRLVKTAYEAEFQYDELSYHSMGTRVLTCDIYDDTQAIFTPCMYKAKCSENLGMVNIVSYRGRYTEHVQTGDRVKARGKLEKVNHRDGRSWLQLVLGEEDSDYLLPITNS